MKNKVDEYKKEDLLRYLRLSPEEKLKNLEKLNKFFQLVVPEKNKKIWQKLKNNGW